jgi:SAM-dependent methyltransferase
MVCESTDLQTIIDLGMHPFADTFIVPERASEADLLYQLACDLCMKCGHIQSRCRTDPEARYSDHPYSYTSSNSAFSRGHWDRYAADVARENEICPGDVVIEVGSNDGYLLEQFSKNGVKVLGIDAAPAVAELATERGVETLVGLFGLELAKEAKAKVGSAKLLVANNVFNHADDIVSFAKAAASLLAPNGVFMFELPYWCIGIRDGHVDQIYHEHVSYLTARASERIARAAGLTVSAIEVVDYHGGSLRVSTRPQVGPPPLVPELKRMIDQEQADRIFDPAMYKEFMVGIQKRRSHFLQKLYTLKKEGVAIVGVGAAAKGNTLLNYYRLDHTVVDCVTDSSPYKQGKLTPGTRIPIRSDQVLAEYPKVAALILSWNLADTLKKVLLEINPRVQFLYP